jgi:hypothetical protein
VRQTISGLGLCTGLAQIHMAVHKNGNREAVTFVRETVIADRASDEIVALHHSRKALLVEALR